jgi:hypothetical protein
MMGLFAAVHESVLLPCQPRRAVSAIGGKSADICSARFSHFDPERSLGRHQLGLRISVSLGL